MQFIELVEQRHSVRKFSATPVEKEKLEAILEAARMAPSAVNFQPWHFIVLTDKDVLEKFYPVYHRDWFRTAPAVIVVLGDHHQGWHRKEDGKDHTDIDVAIAVDHITLAATELGLGTCWVCNFHVSQVTDFFELPSHLEPIALIPVGYPVERQVIPTKKRKEASEIIHWNKF
ncbi:nitroreductase family protein [Prolixibacter sp. NT017]|uniref:nitroreductase family protein n=1 Tax=Prolixibacter sp. NT017 TaxID=2652390 RepID=UPI00126CD172|nr:nitroreductase family protein [Prolixibacter sp. NT017]GET25291.1 nitroreductase [Prolixibacter sp. NT017]